MTCDCGALPSQYVYRTSCLQCCIRLVLSAYPNRYCAQVMLAVIERDQRAPPRADIVASVRKELINRTKKGSKREDENPFPMVS